MSLTTQPPEVDPYARLTDLSHAPALGDYLRELWGRRAFTVAVPINDIRVQNMDTMLGQLWHVLNPAMTIGVYYLIFNVILDVSRGVDNFLGFLVVGVLLFQLSTATITSAIPSINNNEGLIRSVQFPRAVLPLSVVITQHLLFIPTLAVLLITVAVTDASLSAQWLALPLVLLGQVLINSGFALVGARAGHSFPDLAQIVGHVFRLLFYLSGVLFSVDFFVDEEFIPWFALNPFYAVITAARWSLLDEMDTIEWYVLGSVALWAVVLPVFGMVYFMRAEHRYGA